MHHQRTQVDTRVFREAFEALPDAVTLFEPIRDAESRAVDLRVVHMNAAGRARFPGDKPPIGEAYSSIWGDSVGTDVLDRLLVVADSRQPDAGAVAWTDAASFAPAQYDWRAVAVNGDLIAVVVRDETDRALRESAMRASLEGYEAAAAAADADRHAMTCVIEQVVSTGSGLTMVFQPIVDLQTGGLIGVEALSRFSIEPLRPPDQWFADAARVGLGAELELTAVEAALEQQTQLPDQAFMSVNVSPSTVLTAEMSRLVTKYAAHRQIVLELTEHAHVDDYEPLSAALDDVRSSGALLAVDDTGSGYASLQHIHRLNPDHIKLDRYFVDGINSDPVRAALAAALVKIAEDMGTMLIAEGIETAAELAAVRELGIRYGQGYYLAKPGALPVPATAFAHLT